MKFLITMTDIEGEWDRLSPGEQDRILSRHAEFKRALEKEGKFVSAIHLHPRAEARTIRVHEDGSVSLADGPYSEAREYMGGCYVIEADSMDEAVEWARRGRFMVGANEVRQIWEA